MSVVYCSPPRIIKACTFSAYKFQKRVISSHSSYKGNPLVLERMKNDSKLCRQYMPLSKYVVLHDRKYLVRSTADNNLQLSFKTFSDIKPENVSSSVLLSASDHSAIFGVSVKEISDLMNQSDVLIEPRPALFSLCEEDLNLATMSLNLLQWQVDNTYCSKCCSKLQYHTSGRSCKCTRCNLNYFPRYNPVVIMLVICRDYCLLGHNKNFPSHMFSALAGFIDVGETMEQAVVREVYEEVGIHLDVSNVKYMKSDFWGGFRRNYSPELMLGCIAFIEKTQDPQCSDEILDAKWFHKKDIGRALKNTTSDKSRHLHVLEDGSCLQVPPAFSTAHQLMKTWCFKSVV